MQVTKALRLFQTALVSKMSSSSSSNSMAQKWSETANSYFKYFEPSSLVAGRFMFNVMKMQFQSEPLKILEAGCGAGGAAKELLTNLNGLSLDHLYVTDIAHGMLEKAKEKLDGMDKVTIEKSDFTKFHYGDSSMDRYYANMCLHYAPDPDAVLKEAHRVLKPGGIAGFTVWGDASKSPLMTIVPDVLHDFGLDPKDPSKRSSFHLGNDDTALRQKVLDLGFSKCTLIHYPGAMECFEPASYVELIIDGAASTKKQIESFSEEDQKRVRQEVHDRSKAILDQGLPMQLDILILIAQK